MRHRLGKVAGILTGPRFWAKWERFASKNSGSAQVDFSLYTPDRYLLSHCTAVAGVEVEQDGHTICTPHIQWVNENGNAWQNAVLLESYKSFIMAENYLEHIQIKEFSKGKILDAVAWVVWHKEVGYAEKLPTVFVDVLVATDKQKHPKLVGDILSGKLDSMSMGTSVTHTQCSRCGKVYEDGDETCRHLSEDLGKFYRGVSGEKRITAELCGVPGIKGSNDFMEVSWVKAPAFAPAVFHGFLKVGKDWSGKPLKAFVPVERIREMASEV